MLKYISAATAPMGTNCYVVFCTDTLQAAVIDPADADTALAIAGREGLTIGRILLTHGHFDHIAGVRKLKQLTGASVAIHRADAPMLTDAMLNLSGAFGGGFTVDEADELLEDGDQIAIGECSLTVLHTPGHTPGGVCFMQEDVIFAGDTLFYESIGRTDFPAGSYDELANSIREKLYALEEDRLVLPGHGQPTGLFHEMEYNPFIRGRVK